MLHSLISVIVAGDEVVNFTPKVPVDCNRSNGHQNANATEEESILTEGFSELGGEANKDKK